MNCEATESFSSNNGLISQKRKKKSRPNYNSITATSLTFVKSPARGPPRGQGAQTEDLRDVHYDYLWKFICVGDCNVGKSSVLNYYKNVYYNPEDSKPTPGLGLVETRVNFHRYRIHMQLWDTSGDPRFSCLTASLYRDSMAFLLMFDVTSRESFKSVKVWVDHIRTHASKSDPVIYLVGNKVDLQKDRVISEQEGLQLQEAMSLEKYLECGVYEYHNGTRSPDRTRVMQLFAEILNEMIQSIDREIESQTGTLTNQKAYKAKLRQKDMFTTFDSSDEAGLCGGCCSCLPILG